MAALDKLIDLLEQIKQTDPEFTKKASKALDALVGEDDDEPPEEHKEEKPVVKVYPDVVEIRGPHLKEIQDEQRAITGKLTELGLLLQNYESDKEKILDYIEQKQKYFSQYIVDLQKQYDLDPDKKYVINFPQKEGEKATFVKKKD